MGTQVRLYNGTSFKLGRIRVRDTTQWTEADAISLYGPVPIIQTLGIPSAEAFGLPTVAPGAVTIQPSGIPSAEAFGLATLTPGAVGIQTIGIPSEEAFGLATITDPHDPETIPFTSSGTYNVTLVRGWATHLVLVGIGGGEAGTNGSFITGTGGKAGSWNSLIIALASYPALTSISVALGAAGGVNGADGTATTFTGNGSMPSLSCAGGSGGFTGSWNGQDAGNITVDGDPYTGGVGGAGVSGSPGGVPGGGGAGGPVFSAGATGGAGRAWIKAKRVI